MEHKIDEFIRHALDAQPISGTSLIISLYGDALSHRGRGLVREPECITRTARLW